MGRFLGCDFAGYRRLVGLRGVHGPRLILPGYIIKNVRDSIKHHNRSQTLEQVIGDGSRAAKQRQRSATVNRSRTVAERLTTITGPTPTSPDSALDGGKYLHTHTERERESITPDELNRWPLLATLRGPFSSYCPVLAEPFSVIQ